MAWLYVAEVMTVAVAVVATVRLKRAADRNWRMHLAARAARNLHANLEALAASMRSVAAAAQQAAEAMGRLARVGARRTP